VPPRSTLLLRELGLLRERTAEGGDLAREGGLLRRIVAVKADGFSDLRQFHAMLWPAPTDDWSQWVLELARARPLTDEICLRMDPWVSSGTALRLALHVAWAADAGALSRRALREARQRAVRVCADHVRPMFEGRAVDCAPPGRGIELSNQVSAMLAGMLFVGHVFGRRLCRNRLAADLYQRARDAFSLVVGALDAEGYQGEGPIYQISAEAPALILSAELLDEVEGGDHYNRRYPHPRDSRQGTSVARFLENTVTYLYSPCGPCLPLDDYGPGPARAALPLIYAARRSGERRFLDMLAARGPFGVGRFLWMADDLAWRIAYWPRSIGGPRWEGPGSFALSRHFGVVEGRDECRLLQLWDRCEPLPQTHAHINPNSITMEAFGVPVLIEGGKRWGRAPFSVERGMRAAASHMEPLGDVFRFASGDYRDMGSLAIGAHNCVLVDEQDVVRPQRDAAGKLVRFTDGPVASLLVSDSAAVYETSGIRLLAATRVSMVEKRQGLFFVGDDMASRTPHTFTWQAHVRGSCEEIPHGVLVKTREGVGIEVASAERTPFEQRHMPSYPNVFEGESTRLRRRRRGRCVRFVHLLRPLRVRPVIAELTDGWEASCGEVFGCPRSASCSAETDRWLATLAEPAFLQSPASLGRTVTYRKSATIPEKFRRSRIFLHLPLAAGRYQGDVSALWVNGDAFDMAPAAEAAFSMLDSVVEITCAVRFGRKNRFALQVISAPSGGTHGRAFLTALAARSAHAPASVAEGELGMTTRADSGACVANPFGPPCAGTDAVCGITGRSGDPEPEGYGALFDCHRARIDDIDLMCDARMSVQWDAGTIWLLLRPGTSVEADGKTVSSGKQRLGHRNIEVLWQ